jgi:hypothetical protein
LCAHAGVFWLTDMTVSYDTQTVDGPPSLTGWLFQTS